MLRKAELGTSILDTPWEVIVEIGMERNIYSDLLHVIFFYDWL